MDTSRPRAAPPFPYYQQLLSLRYLRSRRSAIAAFLSVAFGVAVIVVVLSIMGGYIDELRAIIRGQESHIMVVGMGPEVSRIARLEKLVGAVPGVLATAPFLETPAMYRVGHFNPCYVRGIHPGKHARVSTLGESVLRPAELETVLSEVGASGSDGDEPSGPGRAPIATRIVDGVLRAAGRVPLEGDELEAFFGKDYRAELLRARNPLVVADLQGDLPPACLVGVHLLLGGEMFLGQVITLVTLKPRTYEPVHEQFVVAGAFKTGDYDADSRVLYVHVDTLKNMLGTRDPATGSYAYDGLRVAVKDLRLVDETRAEIERALETSGIPEYRRLWVRTWEDLRRNLLSAVEIERTVVYLILLLLVVFTACMVFLMLLLTVIEKTRDIGILMALGATPMSVVRVFLANGLVISAVGSAGGLFLGYVFCAFINPIHDWIYARTGLRLFPMEIYHMDRIPTAFDPWDVLWSVGPALLLGFLASLVPAIWASMRDPIKAIHHE